MLDIWIGSINLGPILLVFTFAVILPIQLVLCQKAKSILVRLIPIMLLTSLAVAALVASSFCLGWDGLLYVGCAINLAVMVIVCGIGWGVWSIIRSVKKKRNLKKPTE